MGAAFAEEEDAEDGGGDGKKIGERGELRDLEVAEEPEVEKIGEGGAEESRVEDAGVGLPGKERARFARDRWRRIAGRRWVGR